MTKSGYSKHGRFVNFG